MESSTSTININSLVSYNAVPQGSSLASASPSQRLEISSGMDSQAIEQLLTTQTSEPSDNPITFDAQGQVSSNGNQPGSLIDIKV